MKKLTDELRKQLGKPFGEIIPGKNALEKAKARKGMLVSVGDACSLMFLQNGVKPDVVIYDLKIKRQPVDEGTKAALEGLEGKCVRVVNEASTITPQLEGAVKLALKGKARKVFVDGEEDLAALIVMMHAEDGALIAYGQPDEGLVLLESSEKMRNKARTIYGKMIDV
ncbi:MAG: GTP-dependent dephospho-CoA kinase family protein [Candidatus Burarchaeum sp.]|nr:GTP-dependent dephospho-CoA kinase family protein [Candidatus Burarchaeum sp.]MDO8339851.1 GTP-dependent dephospho-CoA kinase family protein [Candidatus Burarchaeum sp.]